MSNTLTNLQDIRIGEAFLQAFAAALTPVRAFSTDFSSEFAEKGKTVNVPIIGAPAESYNFAGSYAGVGSTVTALPVVLDQHKLQSMHLTDKEVSDSSWPTLEKLARVKAHQLAEDVLKDLWGLITATNYGAPAHTGASDAFDADTVLKIRAACAANKMPTVGRALILDDAYYSALLGDPKVSQSYLVQMSAPALTEARIPKLYGFDVYESTIIPGNSQHLVGFAAVPSAMAIAMRYLQPLRPEEYIAAGALTDPESGITIGYRRYYDKATGKENLAFECVYGRAVALADGLVRITSQS